MDRGARYYKADLQVHTPRDRGWRRRCVSDEERNQFGREMVAVCRATGVQAIAITDHHDFEFFTHIREAARSEVNESGSLVPEHEQLVVFPGLELAVAVPCQLLLIFSADFPTDRLSSVLDKLGIDAADATEPYGKEPVQLLFTSLQDLHDRLDETEWLRGQYIVLPNVTDGGHQTLMRSRMQAAYRSMPCVGGYLDGPVSKVGEGNRRKFAGLDATWGNKRIALIQTSDARTFDKLGSNASWIKWAAPTAEALRQACLAEESRIAHAEPETPNVHITRLVVSNSKFLGPVSLKLNSQYTALIGGRGTGKSSFLEYLRWGLCDQPALPTSDDTGTDLAARRQRLIDLTLEPFDGHVDVHFSLNGIPHLSRRYARSGELLLKVGSADMRSVTQDEVRGLLPIRAYSQRQLSEVGVHLDELTRFVTAPIKAELDALDEVADELARDIRENYVQLQRKRALERGVAQDELTVTSLSQQADAVRTTLAGLSSGNQAVIAARGGHDEARALISGCERRIDQTLAELRRSADVVSQLAAGVRGITPPDTVPEREIVDQLRDETLRLLTRAETAVRGAYNELDAELGSASEVQRLRALWSEREAAFEADYERATGTSSAHKAKLDELTELEQRGRGAQRLLDERAQELELLGDPESRHRELRERWIELQAQRSERLAVQCDRLTTLSDGLIQATIRRGAGTSAQQQRFKLELQGSGVRGAKIEAFLATITDAEQPLSAWHVALDELEAAVLAYRASSAPPAPSAALLSFSASELQRVVAKLTPEAILDLSLMKLDDHPVFEYRAKEGQYIGFADASAGQQATALLYVLLNQAGPPLVMDQPEDDLDSQVIEDIVDRVWDAKRHRQLVFSSHNANLVVNGDAELVACFSYRSAGDHSAGYIELEGAIDVPAVRKRITAVMEGGEKAFRLRKEKYGF